MIKDSLDTILAEAEDIHGIKVVHHVFNNTEMGLLRRVSDVIKNKMQSAVIILGARTTEHASILACVSDDVISKGIKANELINELAPLIKGSGGGRPQMAQAGSREIDKVGEAIKESQRIIREKLS